MAQHVQAHSTQEISLSGRARKARRQNEPHRPTDISAIMQHLGSAARACISSVVLLGLLQAASRSAASVVPLRRTKRKHSACTLVDSHHKPETLKTQANAICRPTHLLQKHTCKPMCSQLMHTGAALPTQSTLSTLKAYSGRHVITAMEDASRQISLPGGFMATEMCAKSALQCP